MYLIYIYLKIEYVYHGKKWYTPHILPIIKMQWKESMVSQIEHLF